MWYNLSCHASELHTGRFFSSEPLIPQIYICGQTALSLSGINPLVACVAAAAIEKGRFAMYTVYSITNLITQRRYIGSTKNLNNRKVQHIRLLEKGSHYSREMQIDWNRYGEAGFSFDVIEEACQQDRFDKETFWISYYQATDPKFGYNHNPSAKDWTGAHHSEESKKKTGAKKRGWKMPDWHRKIMSVVGRKPHPKWRRDAKKGSGNPNARLTKEEVKEIKRMLTDGIKVSPIAKKYKVTYQAIWEIKKGMAWND